MTPQTLTVDPDEKNVEEVHCSECNTPIPAIPNWYAQVRVNFTCDACRQKSPRLAAPAPTLDPAARIAGDAAEPALDETADADEEEEDADAADLELDETEADAVEDDVAAA